MLQPQSQSDERLLAIAARAGDRPAFEQLVRLTARSLFARFYLDTGNAHRAEDLVQETFLLAWRRIGSLDDPAKFRAWLYKIAQSVVTDSVRRESRKKRSAPLAPAHAVEQLNAAISSPLESVANDEERTRVLAILREMPEEYRLPLMLRYLNDADYETIGCELAISNGSLRGLLTRGMNMLRERMKTDLNHEATKSRSEFRDDESSS